MERSPADKWDERYRNAKVEDVRPSEVLVEHAYLLPEIGPALDLACGLGGNALWLAQRGFTVDAWDLSDVAIGKLAKFAATAGLPVEPAVRDVIVNPPPPGSYQLIVVSRFLERALAPALSKALRPGGRLFYQTFGPSGPGPSNPAFRLGSRELSRLFPDLRVLVYKEQANREVMLVAERPE